MPGVKGQIQARGVERRRAIVNAAIEHFARDGYRGTGIAAIAEAAGVTTGGLLHHFGSKENLLVEVLRERDRQAIKAFADVSGESIEHDFERWAAVATWNEARADLASLYTVLLAESLDPHHPAHAYMTDRNRSVRDLLRATLRAGVARGEIAAEVPVERKADEIQAFLEGAQLWWLYHRKKGALTALVRGYLDDQLRVMRPSD